MVNRTKDALAHTPKPQIVIWAEEAAVVQSYADENALAANISALAQSTGAFIGLGYYQNASHYNKFGTN
jgi:apolipoprotein N-acyltransferase